MKTRPIRAGVIGWPVEHSRSPKIHGYWLNLHKIQGCYDRIAVSPDELNNYLRSLMSKGYSGVNVTIPHKEKALGICDCVDDVSVEIGAVNTVWFEGNKLYATNTDAYGFSENLNAQVPNWNASPGSAIILGAGGAARSILWVLAKNGFDRIYMVNRTISKAESLVKMFPKVSKACNWSELSSIMQFANILINTTSLGMAGQSSINLDLSILPTNSIVCDLVYVPLETDLLKSAKESGCRVVDGLGMLLHQAVPGFEKWYGIRPKVTAELRNFIANDLVEYS